MQAGEWKIQFPWLRSKYLFFVISFSSVFRISILQSIKGFLKETTQKDEGWNQSFSNSSTSFRWRKISALGRTGSGSWSSFTARQSHHGPAQKQPGEKNQEVKGKSVTIGCCLQQCISRVTRWRWEDQRHASAEFDKRIRVAKYESLRHSNGTQTDCCAFPFTDSQIREKIRVTVPEYYVHLIGALENAEELFKPTLAVITCLAGSRPTEAPKEK